VTSKMLPRDLFVLSYLLLPTLNDAGTERCPGIYLDSLLVRGSVPVSLHKAHKSLSNHPILSQVVENLRRQSCEGLALPFLINWFMGIYPSIFSTFSKLIHNQAICSISWVAY
jgi:hypothetical protein